MAEEEGICMKKKILVVKFIHETNSFCPVKADEKAFRNMSFLEGEEMFEKNRGVRNELGAFLDVFDKWYLRGKPQSRGCQ